MIAHIVCFQLKETEKASKDENIAEAKKLLDALPNKIDEINAFEVGINYNDTPAAYDLSLYSTFASKEDLEAYAIHPEHLKVVDFIKSCLQNRVVVDYEI